MFGLEERSLPRPVIAGSPRTRKASNCAIGVKVCLLGCIFLYCIFATDHIANATENNPAPILLSELTSTRAIALESIMFTREPFPLTSPYAWNLGNRTRVTVFALNLRLQSGEDALAVTADAEDAGHRHYNLPVEYVGVVPSQEWMSAIVLKLSDDLGDVGDVLVRITYRGNSSNRVRVAIGHLGGGPPDDDGAHPTPAPPYTITGQIKSGSQAMSGVSLTLTGAQTLTAETDASGYYSFLVNTPGDYSLVASKAFFNFSPTNRVISRLSNHQSSIDFSGARQSFTISGLVQDDRNQALDGIEVTLTDESGAALKSSITGGGGKVSFADMPAGFVYTLKLKPTDIYTFAPQSTSALSGNLSLSLPATRRPYIVYGTVMDHAGNPMAGARVDLGGARTDTLMTDSGGNYAFERVPAGLNYTVTPAQTVFYDFTTFNITNLAGNRTANFTGARRPYTITGRVTDNAGDPLAGERVNLGGARTATQTTDSGGNYSFEGVPSGLNYTVTPADNVYYSFPLTNISNLAGNQTANFTGTLRAYTLSGKVVAGAVPLSGATVTLGGSQNAVTSTDAAGNYSFTNLIAKRDYTITPSKQHYLFGPTQQAFNRLGGSQDVDFSASLRQYQINGRVVDATGHGLGGVTLTVNGTQTGTARTGVDGTYSYSATALGEYTITPSIEQDYYSFGPSNRTVSGLTGNATADFTAARTPLPDPSHVLEFDGSPMSVDYDWFWGAGDLGHFYWEFWAMPADNAGAAYLLSDGYGGAHSLLFGFGFLNASEPGRYQLFGDIWDGVPDITHITFFGSDQGPAVGEWGHFAVGWDGRAIVTYFNGVPVGKAAFAGPRQSPGQQGGGKLLIGGSDHNNLPGRIAQVRGFEGTNPREDPTGVDRTAPEGSFAPQTVFEVGGNLLSYYFRPGARVADLSRGYEGIMHPGTPRGTTAGIPFDCGNCPPPQFVIDPTGPSFKTGTPQQPVRVSTPPPVPNGVRVFDSFSRANSTYIFNGTGGLGSTEGGSAGSQLWRTSLEASGLKPFGILNGQGVVLANASHVTWVPTGSTTAAMDIRVDRRPRAWGTGRDTGLSFRVSDANNYFFAYTSESESSPNTQTLTVGYYFNGQRTVLVTGVTMPANWITLRVITKSTGTLDLYADTTLIYSVNNSLMSAATGAGLYNNSAGLGLVNRWDNFAIYDVP